MNQDESSIKRKRSERMFKRFLLSLALTLVFALPANAEVSGIYGGLKFIDSIQSVWGPDVSGVSNFYSQNTVGGGVFLGYDFYPKNNVPLRTEIEYAIRTNTTRSESLSGSLGGGYTAKADLKGTWGVQTLLANMYLDFHNDTAFTPYIGAGVGMGFITTKYSVDGKVNSATQSWSGSVSKNQLNTVLAWNVGAGCSYAFSENVSADLGYRYLGLGGNSVSYNVAGFKGDLNSVHNAHEFSLGLRMTF